MSQSFYKTSLAAGVLLAAIAGCKTAPQALPDLRVGDTAAVARPAAAPVDASATQAPQVRLQLRTPKDTPGYRVQDVPLDWDEAVVSFHSPTVSAPYARADHTRTVSKSAFTQGGGLGLIEQVLLTNPGNPMKTMPDAVSPDGTKIYTAWSSYVSSSPLLYDNQIFAFTLPATPGNEGTISVVAQHQFGGFWMRIARSADKILVADNGAGWIQVYGSAGNFITQYDAGGQPWAIEADGNTALYTLTNGTLMKMDLTNGSKAPLIYGFGNPEMNLSDGKLTVAKGGASGQITVYDSNNGATLVTIPAPGVTSAIAVGSRVYACFQSKNTLVAYEMADPSVEIPISNNLDVPSRIMYANGWIYICENGTNHRLLRQDISTAGHSAPTFEAPVSLPALRPAADYEARIYLKRAGRIAGSAVVPNKALKAGANTMLLTVPTNINVSNASLYGGATSVQKATNTYLLSGLMASQAGVARVEYKLSGTCYTGTQPVLIGKTTGTSDRAMWLWQPTVVSEQYDPTKLQAGTGQIEVNAYDDHGDRVHTATYSFPVVN